MSLLNHLVSLFKKFFNWSGKFAAEQLEANKQRKLYHDASIGFRNHVYQTLTKIDSYVNIEYSISDNGSKIYNLIIDNAFNDERWGQLYQVMGFKLSKSVSLEVLEDVQTAFASNNIYPNYRFYVTKKRDSQGVSALIFVMLEKDKVNDFDLYLHNLKI